MFFTRLNLAVILAVIYYFYSINNYLDSIRASTSGFINCVILSNSSAEAVFAYVVNGGH